MKKVLLSLLLSFIIGGYAFSQCSAIITYNDITLAASCSYNCDGSVSLTPAGGDNNGFYTYTWTDQTTNSQDVNLCPGTVYCTITDGGQCQTVAGPFVISAPSAININNVTSPDSNCTPPYNGCVNWIVSGGDGTYTYSPWGSGGTGSSDCTLAQGSYNVTVTDGAGCTATSSANVGFTGGISVNLGPPDTTQCGGTVTLNAGNPGGLYSWSDNETTQIITVNASNTYSVLVTDPNTGCTATGSISVNVLAAPAVNLGPNVVQCGGNVTLDAGNPGEFYQWSDGSSAETTIASTSGTYAVTVVNDIGCSASGSIEVYIQPTPYVNLGPDTSQCGGSITLNAGNPGDSYSWSDNETTQTITVTGFNNYSVVVTDPNSGCTASGTITVSIAPTPVVSLGPDVNQCGGSVTLDAGNPGNIYSWSDGTSNETTVVTTSGQYSVTVTNDFNCTAADSVNVYIQSVPTVYLGQDITQCGGKVTLDAGDPNSIYLWSTNATTQTILVSASGPYSVTVTSPVDGCTAADTINVAINPVPVVNLGHDTTQCGGSITLDAGNSGATYLWSDNSTNETLVVTTSGIYRVTVTNSFGCSATGSITVTINPIPAVTLSLPANVCITVPPFVLTGGMPVGGTYYEDDTAIIIFAPYKQGIGAHQITYVYTNIYGCADSDSASIFVRPQPFISTVPPPYLCSTSPEINLNNFITPPGGRYFGIGVSQNYFYPVLSSPGKDTIVDIYTDNFGCMDTASYVIPVHAPVHVDMTSSVADFTICTNQSITFTATGAEFYQFFVNGVAQDTPTLDSTFTTTTLTNHSIITVVGSNPCSTDTSEPIVIDVIVPPVVNAGHDTTINLGQTVQLNGTATGNGNLTYLWTPGYGLNYINIPNPIYSGSDTVTFWLKAEDSYGCSDSAQVTINVYVPDNVQLPTVITPNGDGYNDVWKLNSKINLDGSHLVIFDRWGEVVFETDNYANNWGGTYKTLTGKLLPDDTYYYNLKVPAQNNHIYTGPINIISGKQ